MLMFLTTIFSVVELCFSGFHPEQRVGARSTLRPENLEKARVTFGVTFWARSRESGAVDQVVFCESRSTSFFSTASGTRPATQPPEMTTSLMMLELM